MIHKAAQYIILYFIIEQWFWALIELKFFNSIEKQLTWYILNCKQAGKISIHLVGILSLLYVKQQQKKL